MKRRPYQSLRPQILRLKAEAQPRRQVIAELRDEYGATFGQIGECYGITSERARQLYRKVKSASV